MVESRRVIWGTVISLVLFAGLISGCCEDCKTPTEPIDPLLGIWQCVRYEMEDVSQESLIGSLMGLEAGGSGYSATPDMEILGTFTWASTGSTLFMEVPEMGLSMGMNYTATRDSLYLWADGGFLMPSYESDWIRFSE